MSIYIKRIPTPYMMLGYEGFPISDILRAIEEMEETSENDTYGDCSYKEYELNNYECTNALVKLDYVTHYTGSRMASCYKIKDKIALSNIKEEIYSWYDKNET